MKKQQHITYFVYNLTLTPESCKIHVWCAKLMDLLNKYIYIMKHHCTVRYMHVVTNNMTKDSQL